MPRWKSVSWYEEDGDNSHIYLHYGWNERRGYWIKVGDDRLEVKMRPDDFGNELPELDALRESILDGENGCYFSCHTGPGGAGIRVSWDLMATLWILYNVPFNRFIILCEEREVEEPESEEAEEAEEADSDVPESPSVAAEARRNMRT